MVYMEPGSLGFEPLVVSWLDSFPPYVLERTTCREKLRILIDQYVLDTITFVKRFCSEPVLTTTNNLVQSMMRLIDTFLYPFLRSPTNHMEEDGPPMELTEKLEEEIESIFIFSLIWSVGACIDLKSRYRFSNYLRSLCLDRQCLNVIPAEGLVYDYCVHEDTGLWCAWINPEFIFEPKTAITPFNEIVVPTKDTVRTRYVLQKLISNRSHVLITGGTGTGKTTIVMQYLSGTGEAGSRPSTQLEKNALKRTVRCKIEKVEI